MNRLSLMNMTKSLWTPLTYSNSMLKWSSPRRSKRVKTIRWRAEIGNSCSQQIPRRRNMKERTRSIKWKNCWKKRNKIQRSWRQSSMISLNFLILICKSKRQGRKSLTINLSKSSHPCWITKNWVLTHRWHLRVLILETQYRRWSKITKEQLEFTRDPSILQKPRQKTPLWPIFSLLKKKPL